MISSIRTALSRQAGRTGPPDGLVREGASRGAHTSAEGRGSSARPSPGGQPHGLGEGAEASYAQNVLDVLENPKRSHGLRTSTRWHARAVHTIHTLDTDGS